MAEFLIAYKETLDFEGGKVNHKLDRGGQTYMGISRKNWPYWAGWQIIDQGHEPPIELIHDFYKLNFWDRISLGAIINQKIANELFDTGVNMHPKVSINLLQKSLNLLNRNGKLYPEITADGILGSQTLKLTNEHPYPDALLKLLNGLQLARYVEICEADPTQEEFLRGWLKRVYFV